MTGKITNNLGRSSGVVKAVATGTVVNWCTTAKTSGFTAASTNGYFINTSGGAVTVTLPSSPSAGDIVGIKDYAGTWGTACKAVTIGRGGSKLDGDCADAIRNTAHESLTLVYVDGTQGWKSIEEGTGNIGETFMCASGGNTTITSGDYKTHIFTGDGTFTVNSISASAANNIVDYAVIAGAGGGGSNNYGGGNPPRGSGGGGAGGFRIYSTAPGSNSPLNNSGASPNTAITVTATNYPITIGAGGAGAPSGSPDGGSKGNNSVFSTVTSALGGAGGGHCNMCCRDGGSGGGGRNAVCGGAGNTPPVAPPQGNPGGDGGASSGTFNGSGGGGAGAAGSDGDPSGVGGAGSFIADPFFGPTAPSYGSPGPTSSTRYFAGGGAGSPGPGGAVSGGDGGGGPKGTSGTANTGGGGGANSPGTGGTGGSGIVMIRYKFQ
tara:strand:+ start:961 stop:2265 length:1305 start_codon:yes stop_codon:yes gene_type:complete